jgi:hypothetical protein
LRNDGQKTPPKNHWIGIDLRGRVSAPKGEGSRITVTDATGRKQIFDVNSAGSYLASSDPRILVGLGAESVAKVEIHWPSGKDQILQNLTVDRYYEVNEK